MELKHFWAKYYRRPLFRLSLRFYKKNRALGTAVHFLSDPTYSILSTKAGDATRDFFHNLRPSVRSASRWWAAHRLTCEHGCSKCGYPSGGSSPYRSSGVSSSLETRMPNE